MASENWEYCQRGHHSAYSFVNPEDGLFEVRAEGQVSMFYECRECAMRGADRFFGIVVDLSKEGATP